MVGCLIRLALLPLCVGLSYVLLSLRAPFPSFEFLAEGAEVAAVPAGLFLWFAMISWLEIRQIATDLAVARDWRLEDGERTVIAGHVGAEEETLEAPFSGERCVGYWYEVSHYSPSSTSKISHWTDYEGFALVPSIVRGPMRTLKVLAEPDKKLFHEVPAREITSDEHWARAEDYVRETDFGEEPSGPLADTRTRRRHEGPGSFREDKQVREPPKDLRAYKPAAGEAHLGQGQRSLKEKIIREGDTVLIAGVYSEEKGGIAPDPDTIMRPFRIVVGGEVPLRRKIRNRLIGIAISLGLALGVGAIYFLFFVS